MANVLADVASASSVENSDNESARSSVDEGLDYALRKARPVTEDFDEDIKDMITKEVLLLYKNILHFIIKKYIIILIIISSFFLKIY